MTPLPCRTGPASTGAPMLWVHGYTLDGTIWGPSWQALPGWQHIALDLPGHGRARPLRPGEALDGLAAEVIATARAVGARHLVGMSFGGMVALQAAIAAPEAFDAVVLASPGLAGGPQDAEAATCNQALMRMARDRGIGPWLADRWMMSPPRIFDGSLTRPVLRERLAEVVARHGWRELIDGSMQGLQACAQTPESLARITARLLILVGGQDMPVFLRSAELLRRAVPGARRVVIEDAAHMCLLESPEASAAQIRAHLAPVAQMHDV